MGGEMVTREQESMLREVVRKHLDNATNEIIDKEVADINVWWTDGFLERLSEQVVQSLALMSEQLDHCERETD